MIGPTPGGAAPRARLARTKDSSSKLRATAVVVAATLAPVACGVDPDEVNYAAREAVMAQVDTVSPYSFVSAGVLVAVSDAGRLTGFDGRAVFLLPAWMRLTDSGATTTLPTDKTAAIGFWEGMDPTDDSGKRGCIGSAVQLAVTDERRSAIAERYPAVGVPMNHVVTLNIQCADGLVRRPLG